MGFIFLLLIACLFVAFICYIANGGEGSAAFVGFLIAGIVSTIIMACVWGDSYSCTVSMQERLISIEQYAQTVKVYSKRAVAEFKHDSSKGSELTDLKYQNYQTQIGDMITDLRDQINKYNTKLVGKRIMGNSWFWSWCIFPAPESSVVLKMSDYID